MEGHSPSKQQRQQRRVAGRTSTLGNIEDEAARISAELDQWQSPRLGSWQMSTNITTSAAAAAAAATTRNTNRSMMSGMHPDVAMAEESLGRNAMDMIDDVVDDDDDSNDHRMETERQSMGTVKKSRAVPDDNNHNNHTDSAIWLQTPLEISRVGTPVMSNSSQKHTKHDVPQHRSARFGISTGSYRNHTPKDHENDDPYYYHGGGRGAVDDPVDVSMGNNFLGVDDEDSYLYPVNVHSPWPSTAAAASTTKQSIHKLTPAKPSTPASSVLGIPSTLHTTSRMPSNAVGHADCRRYYEAFLTFVQSKRGLQERIDLREQSQQLLLLQQTGQLVNETTAMATTTTKSLSTIMMEVEGKMTSDKMIESRIPPPVPDTSKLFKDEVFMELNFLRTLNAICWDRDDIKEGNFWRLLHCLRQQGTASLIWGGEANGTHGGDDSSQLLVDFLAQKAAAVESSPAQVVQSLQADDAPLELRRRYQIMHWLQECFRHSLPQGRARPVDKIKKNAVLQNEGLCQTEQDAGILKDSLNLLLAGRLEDALQYVRDCNVPWRAAIWGGGKPHDPPSNGNPRRFLWKRSLWKLSDQLEGEPTAIASEGAITALLASHLKNALSNQALRSWERGLFAVMYCMIERITDEVLHQHNENRRAVHPPYPILEQISVERDMLRLTSDLSSFNEINAVSILASSPFEEMQCHDVVTEATACFLAGKESILEYFEQIIREFDSDDDMGMGLQLRFATHLALYLDSLSFGTTPVVLPGVRQWKDILLVKYIDFLTSREDLWYMIVLYASLLPVSYVLQELPQILAALESPVERERIVHQLREFLPQKDLDLEVLRRVVNFILEEDDRSEITNESTLVDVRKMRAIQWLNFDSRFASDALIAANKLIRQFFLLGKFMSAVTFVDAMFPMEILNEVNSQHDPDEAVRHALFEFSAYRSYIEALTLFEQWKVTVEKNPEEVDEDPVDRTNLNATELAIAEQMDRRRIIDDAREFSQAVITAAGDAQRALLDVLKHPGGWLHIDNSPNGSLDATRDKELVVIRAKLLPQVVRLYQDLCLKTSSWLSSLLSDVAFRLDKERREVVSLLDESEDSGTSPLAPHYWARLALDVTQIVASDTYMISNVFDRNDLQAFLETLSEAAVAELCLRNF